MVDAAKFFAGYRQAFGALSQDQVDGLNFLLTSFNADPTWGDVRNISYSLATILLETAHTFQPIHELGSDQYLSKYWTNPRLRVMLGNTEPADAQRFKGRGYVQITGRANYAKFGLVNDPESALQPATAFQVMTKGMFEGIFTGRKLGDFINELETDYVSARRVINGQDRASQIAHDAVMFEQILTEPQV